MPITTSDTIGAFVFRNEGNGCITSKYHHRNTIDGPFTEMGKLIPSLSASATGFLGHYKTIWLEQGNNFDDCNLEIKANLNPAVFDLIWYDATSPTTHFFEGTAMLYGDLLVGAYWKV